MVVRSINGLSLCSGVGGLDLGLRIALGSSFRTCCYVEREAFAAEVLVSHMDQGRLHPAPVWSDLTTFDGRRWGGAVHLVFGGIPCQPASTAGKREGSADDRWLWGHTVRILREVGSEWFFFENVGGLFSGKVLDVFWDDFIGPTEEMGYRIASGLFTAAEVGAPHKRERCFLLGRKPVADGQVQRRCDPPTTDSGGRYQVDEEAEAFSSPTDRGVRVTAGRTELDDPGYSKWRCPQHREQQEGTGVDHRSGRGLPDMAHPEGREAGSEHNLRPREPNRSEGGRTGVGQADTNQSRSQGWSQSVGGSPNQLTVGQSGTEDDGFPLWPPRPSDREGWGRVLTRFPDFAPATETETQPQVHGVVDGVAQWVGNRTDELRACGNGVVPLQAAYAFRFLLRELVGSNDR